MLACALLTGCERAVARVGGSTLRAHDVQQRFAALADADKQRVVAAPADFVRGMLAAQAIEQEAIARGLKDADALRTQLRSELQTQLHESDVSEDELLQTYREQTMYRFNPARVAVVQITLPTEAAAARAAASTSADMLRGFSARYPDAIAWDVLVTRDRADMAPAVKDKLFAAKPGSVVRGENLTVYFVTHQLPETNSFSEVKDRLRPYAYAAKLDQALRDALHAICSRRVQVDARALARLGWSGAHVSR